MRISLATAMTAFLPLDRLRVTREIGQDQKASNELRRPLIPLIRDVYPERSTLMSHQREQNSTERLLEPSDTPVSPGTIRAVVVVGLITLFIASFLYWQSWKERHNKPPCVTKVKQELSDVVTVQCKRIWGDRAAAASGGGPRNDSGSKGDQKSRKNSEVPTTRGKTRILRESPVSSSPRSTTPLTSTSSSIYHSQASSQMFLICETHTPTEREVPERLAVEAQPKSITRIPSEQIISHI